MHSKRWGYPTFFFAARWRMKIRKLVKESHNIWILYWINVFGPHRENISKNADVTKLFVLKDPKLAAGTQVTSVVQAGPRCLPNFSFFFFSFLPFLFRPIFPTTYPALVQWASFLPLRGDLKFHKTECGIFPSHCVITQTPWLLFSMGKKLSILW